MPMLHEKLFRLLSTAKSNVRATLQTPSASKPLASDAAPQPSSKPQSLAVGSTGMVIHLIDLAHRPVVIGKVNDSSQQAADPQKSAPELNPNFIEAIGESSLPVTFKNLQRSAAASRFEPGVLGLAFGLSAGANGIAQTCQFAIRLKEPAMELNLAKDQHWQYLNQLLVNVTNTETLRSGGVEITDEDKQRDEARAAAVARKNSAYASMVSATYLQQALMSILFYFMLEWIPVLHVHDISHNLKSLSHSIVNASYRSLECSKARTVA